MDSPSSRHPLAFTRGPSAPRLGVGISCQSSLVDHELGLLTTKNR